ncbi:vancomycin B-type resistance protein VanW [Peptococcaceae bacterium CEB3]|nr:vancomycin B-type resistance protein VanW [Peptococcaceae bacterium CEB3]
MQDKVKERRIPNGTYGAVASAAGPFRREGAGLFLLVLSVFLLLSGCGRAATPQIQGNIPAGTKVDNLDLSGSETKAAQEKLKGWAKGKLAQNLRLVYNGTEVPVSMRSLGANLDLNKTWQAVSAHPGDAISSYWTVNKGQAEKTLKKKLSRFDLPAQNASYKIAADKFIVQPGVPGRTVDTQALIGRINGHTWQDIDNKEIEIPMTTVAPKVSTESVQRLAFNSVIGEFTTKYAVAEKDRSGNLQRAAAALDKKIVLPGQTFSFNDTVGPRTESTGYKDAYVIVDNKYVEGVGGGVCQVSSTLYNAALLADLKIAARTPHAMAITYVPLGQDATVDYNNKVDFKFQNNTDGLLYIRSQTKPGLLTIRIYGKQTGKTVTLKHEIVKETNFQVERQPDPSLPSGATAQEQAGNKGYTVKSWRVVKDAQGKVTEEYLGQDVYAPTNQIIRYGVKGIR